MVSFLKKEELIMAEIINAIDKKKTGRSARESKSFASLLLQLSLP
jgi:hypothetical protein